MTDTRPLSEIIHELLAKSKAQKLADKTAKVKKQVKQLLTAPAEPSLTEREIRMQRILSSRWKEEQLILLVTRVRCECGELYHAPHPRMFIRRFHPQFGLHMEPLCVRPHSPMLADSPPIVEYVDENASICHRCLPVRSAIAKEIAKQTSFDFTDTILQNLPLLTENTQS